MDWKPGFVTGLIARTSWPPAKGWRNRPMADRAAYYLKRLDTIPPGVGRDVFWRTMCFEFDLLSEEAALDDSVLAFQIRMFELRDTDRGARWLIHELIDGAPMWKLYRAIFREALDDGCSRMRFDMPTEHGGSLTIHFEVASEWREVMVIPNSLAVPIRGSLRRLEHGGYDLFRPYFGPLEGTPSKAVVTGSMGKVIEVELT